MVPFFSGCRLVWGKFINILCTAVEASKNSSTLLFIGIFVAILSIIIYVRRLVCSSFQFANLYRESKIFLINFDVVKLSILYEIESANFRFRPLFVYYNLLTRFCFSTTYQFHLFYICLFVYLLFLFISNNNFRFIFLSYLFQCRHNINKYRKTI